MQLLIQNRNIKKANGIKKRNFKYIYSSEVIDKRHLRDSYLSTLRRKLKRDGREKRDDYETIQNINPYKNFKGTFAQHYQNFNSLLENENFNLETSKNDQIKEINSKLTTKENASLKKKIKQYAFSSMNDYSDLKS